MNGAVPDVWSVADASMRWPPEDQPRWAQAACPKCELMAVRVQPGRNGRPSRYRCTTSDCDWEANSKDDDGLWASVFAEAAPPEIRVHDPRWLTLADAARLVDRTTGTVRAWVTQELLEPQLGPVLAGRRARGRGTQEGRGRMKGWLRLTEAARRIHGDAALASAERRIRRWVAAGELKSLAGRFRAEDVLAAEKAMRGRRGRPRKTPGV